MAIAPLIDNFIIDMADEQNYYFAKAPQGDGRSRFIDVKILEDGEPWDIPSRAFVTIEGHNGGNYNIVNECEVIDDNTIRISLSNGILTFPGVGVYRVSFYESNNPTHTVVGSFNFNIFVSECPYDVIRLEASDEYEALTNLIEKVGETNKWIVGDYDPPFVTEDVNINDLYLAAPTGSVYKYTESPIPDEPPYWLWQFNMKVKIYISYSYEDDHSDMDDDPSSITPFAKYIGIYTGLETDPTQLEPTDYKWSIFRGGVESMTQTTSLVDGADNPISVVYTDGATDTFHVRNGHTGSSGGFGTPIVDNTHAAEVGTPSVEVETDSSSPETAKVFKFTFKQLKGLAGERGSKWFKGLQISGGLNGSPIVNNFVGTALVEDLYMNTSSVEGGDGGNVYSCTQGGTDTDEHPGQNTRWELKYTISGGGGGGGGSNVTWTQITPASGNTKIAEIEIDGVTQNVYAPSGGGTTSYNDLLENTLPKINNVMLKGSLTSTDLGITWTGTHEDYKDDMALDLIPDGTVVIFTDDFVDPANLEWDDINDKPFESVGSDFEVNDDDELELSSEVTQKLEKIDINENLSTALGEKADSATTLAGYGITDAYTKTEVDTALAGKASTSDLDTWTAEQTVNASKQVTFTGLNDSYSYKLFCDAPMTSVTNIVKTGSGTSVQLVYTLDGTNLLVGTSKCKLRVIH